MKTLTVDIAVIGGGAAGLGAAARCAKAGKKTLLLERLSPWKSPAKETYMSPGFTSTETSLVITVPHPPVTIVISKKSRWVWRGTLVFSLQ